MLYKLTGCHLYVLFVILSLLSSNVYAIKYCITKGEWGCFTGNFQLNNIEGDRDHKLIAFDFGYVDPKGIGWQTNANTKTDGATIPKILQPFIGSPWEEGYIYAAVIHDWYCVRHVRSWRDTHMVFYDAMISNGMSKNKAKLLFYAVYAFGPRWGYLAHGETCSKTEECIQENNSNKSFILIPSDLNNAENISDLKDMQRKINFNKDDNGFSINDLMAISDRKHPQKKLLQELPTGEDKIYK